MRFRSFGRHAQATPTLPEESESGARSRRPLMPVLLTLIIVTAVSALAASAAAPSHPARATAQRQPNYLQPVGTLIHHGYLPFPALLGDTGDIGVPDGTTPAPTRPDPTVVAQQAPAIAQFQGANGTLTPAGIAVLALTHGCDPAAAVTATAIAMAESGGSPSAQGDIGLMTDVWDWSAGLWQIRGLREERGTGDLRDSIANQDPSTNAAAMYVVSGGCSDWTPWSTYNDGLYQQFLPIAAQAVRYVLAYYGAHGQRYPPIGAPDPTATIPVQGSGGTTSPSGTAGTPMRHPTSSPNPTRAPAPQQSATPTPRASRTATAPAPAPTSAARSATSRPRLSLPVPVPTLPTSSLPLPKPSLSIPLPSPSLSLPSLPGLP